MDNNFFYYLCVPADVDGNKAALTSEAVPLKNCQCNGNDYNGMPDIEFSLQLGEYETDYSYQMKPNEFEMLPKVDESIRNTMCNLGLWNLENKNKVSSSVNRDSNEFAVG